MNRWWDRYDDMVAERERKLHAWYRRRKDQLPYNQVEEHPRLREYIELGNSLKSKGYYNA